RSTTNARAAELHEANSRTLTVRPRPRRPNTKHQRSNPMPVTNVIQDLDARTLIITAEFAAPVERIWQVYADARQLEKIWGPPTYPATFVDHDLTPGGKVHYYMTSPEGEKFYGWWKVTAVNEP